MTDAPHDDAQPLPGDPRSAVDLVRGMIPYLHCASRVAGKCVLDLGCGPGHGAHHLAGFAREVHAFDSEPTMVASARSQSRAPNLTYHVEGVDPDPVPGSYQAVCAFGKIDRQREPGPLLERLAAFLAADGELLLTAPNALRSEGETFPPGFAPADLVRALERSFPVMTLLGITGNGRYRAYRERLRATAERSGEPAPTGAFGRWVSRKLDPILGRAPVPPVRSGARAPRGLSAFAIEPDDFRVDADRIEEADDLLAICAR
jgi:SAM-dependent methyltransferase